MKKTNFKKGLQKKIVAAMLTFAMVGTSFSNMGFSFVAKAETTTEMENASSEETEKRIILTPEDRQKYCPTGLISDKEDQQEETVESMQEYLEILETYNETPNSASDDLEEVAATLPKNVDNSKSQYFPEIKSQNGGSCGCWADVYYNGTYTLNRARRTVAVDANGKNIDSRVLSPSFVYNQTRVGDSTNNGTFSSDNTYFMELYGSCTQDKVEEPDEYPLPKNWQYTWYPTEEAWLSAMENRMDSHKTLGYAEDVNDTIYTHVTSPDDPSLDIIKSALAEGAVLPFSTGIYTWQNMKISDGEYKGFNIYTKSDTNLCKGETGPHRMTLVGYDDTIWVDINENGVKEASECGAFKVANSWGKDGAGSVGFEGEDGETVWAFEYDNNEMGGFYWISYDSLNRVSAVSGVPASSTRRCIFNEFPRQYFVEKGKEYKKPTYYLRTTLNTPSRKEVRTLKVLAYKNGSLVGSKSMKEVFSENNPGARDLYGTAAGTEDGTLAFDLSDIASGLNSENKEDYVFVVEIKENSANDNVLTVKELSLVDETGSILYDVELDQTNNTVNGTTKQWSLSPLRKVELSASMESGKVTAGQQVTFAANCNWSGDIAYEFEVKDVMSTLAKSETSSNNTFTWITEYSDYPIKVKVTATDRNTGITKTTEMPYRVNQSVRISGSKKAPSELQYGESAELILSGSGGTGTLKFKLETNYEGQGYKTYKVGPVGYMTWTPDKAGSYELRYSIVDENGCSASTTSTCNVLSNATPSVPPTMAPTPIPVQGTNVYFDNSNAAWSNVYAYVWADGVSAKVLDTTKLTNGIYKVTVPANYKKMIFKNTNNGWDKQTGDLTIPSDSENCWKPNGSANKSSGIWYAYRDVNEFSVELALNGTKGNVNAKAVVSNGTAPYKFTFVDSKDGETRNPIETTTSTDYCYHTLSAYLGGTYATKVTVTDANGKVATASASLQIGSLKITSITPDVTPGVVGQKVSFRAAYENEYFYKFPSAGSWSIKDENGTVVSYSDSFTPTKEGTYYVTYTLTDSSAETASKTIEYVVKSDKSNLTTVYYNNTWDKAYVHYCINNGNWTSGCGVQMKTSDRADYKWMYTIDLGEQTGVTVCFNNGNGQWDSKNGANYALGVGTYGVKNGNIYQLGVAPTMTPIVTPTIKPTATPIVTPTVNPTATPIVTPTVKPTATPIVTPTISPTATPIEQSYVTVAYNNAVTKWSNVYAYVWNTPQDPVVFEPAYTNQDEFVFHITGKYTYVIFKNTKDTWEKKTADLKLPAYTTDSSDKCFTPASSQSGTNGSWGSCAAMKYYKALVPSVTADKTTVFVGDEINFHVSALYENGYYKNYRCLEFAYEDGTKESLYSYAGNVFENTGEYTYTVSWTPKKEGTVTVTYVINQYQDHVEYAQPITLNVVPKGNVTTVYYENTSFSNANVHYKVGNGQWTNGNGVQMIASDRAGYTWMYIINLGTSDNVTTCFNNGNGTWDSKNGSNYILGKGSYGVKNGTIVKLD